MAALPLRSFVKPARTREPPVTPSVLSRGLTISGHLEVDGDIVVHGHIAGRIDAAGVTIGASGSVEGDIVAREVRIAGRLEGRVFAHHVSVDATATVDGRLFHHTIAIEKGARIDARMPWRPLNYFETLDQLPETRP